MSDRKMRSSLKDNIAVLRARGRSLMAFNVQSLAQLSGLVSASEQQQLPVIAQMSAKYVTREAMRAGLNEYISLAGRASVYLHLDHCTDKRLIHHCIRQGFDSVMMDGSALSFEENCRRTNEVVALAHPSGCLVEAELGRIGGVEDDMGGVEEDGFSAVEFGRFCELVKADLLAPAIGNAHGFYSDPGRVRIDQLPEAHACLREGQALVLHGGTGLDDDAIFAAIRAGVVKINISTHLKQRTQELLRRSAESHLYDDLATTAAVADGLVEFYSDYICKFTAC